MLFVFAIPMPWILQLSRSYYIGTFTANVWHNATIIFLFPFAILLFNLSIKQLSEYDKKTNWWIALLVFLNVFIKPSYFFVWVCVYPPFLLLTYRFGKEFLWGVFPVIAGVFCLAVEYYVIYLSGNTSGSGIGIALFDVYKRYSPIGNLPIGILFSLLFPILYICLNLKTAIKDKQISFSAISAVLAIVISLVLIETGPRKNHGNFFWQVIPCVWLLFYVTLNKMLKTNRHKKLLYAVYFCHFLAGIIYLARYFVFKNFDIYL